MKSTNKKPQDIAILGTKNKIRGTTQIDAAIKCLNPLDAL
jgi:hypothetical protein